ncbi:MAG: DUF1552 domain-containing protein [Myxococcota bacterium]
MSKRRRSDLGHRGAGTHGGSVSRRSFLRGAGTVAIGLPLFAELGLRVGAGQPVAPPRRLVTAFFGLGIHPDWQGDFNGPLEPLEAFASKMATFGCDMPQGTFGGAHCNTSTVVFVGERPASVDRAGGPSLDQKLRRALGGDGGTLASGLWFRRGACDAQANRVYNPDGTARLPVKRPSEVFDRLFGSVAPMPPPPPVDPDPPAGPDPALEAQRRELRIERSVLDTVVAQYRHYRGDASPLGAASKLKLELHLESIRALERRLVEAEALLDAMDPGDGGGGTTEPVACAPEAEPRDPTIADVDLDRFTYGTGRGAPSLDWRDAERLYRLHADLWAVALRCDAVRFGNLMFESAGGHMNLFGRYEALGDSTEFPGTSQHDSYFHGSDFRQAQLYQHFALRNVGYFLAQLDDPAHRDEDGRTVLDTTTVLVGTEYGWNHSKDQAFHAVVGDVGRFRAGSFTSTRMNCIDLYNAVLEGHGVRADVGEATGVEGETDVRGLLLR